MKMLIHVEITYKSFISHSIQLILIIGFLEVNSPAQQVFETLAGSAWLPACTHIIDDS